MQKYCISTHLLPFRNATHVKTTSGPFRHAKMHLFVNIKNCRQDLRAAAARTGFTRRTTIEQAKHNFRHRLLFFIGLDVVLKFSGRQRNTVHAERLVVLFGRRNLLKP